MVISLLQLPVTAIIVAISVEDSAAMKSGMLLPDEKKGEWPRRPIARFRNYLRQACYTAGHDLKDDQSIVRINASSAGNVFLNVNANGVGPCLSRCASRFFASSTPGIWPTGTHHKAT